MSADTFVALAGILVEGAVDAFCGRPKHANPYCEQTVMEASYAWAWGHDEATLQLEIRGREEAARWLREAA